MTCVNSQLFDLVNPELWIVTAVAGRDRGGLLATWIMQAAIDPQAPALVAGLAPNHYTTRLIQDSGWFAAHLLLVGQEDLAWNFAKDSGRTRDKLQGIPLAKAESLCIPSGAPNVPILRDAAAYALCQVLHSEDVGDRVLFHAQVMASQVFPVALSPNADMLKQKAFFASLSSQQKQALKQDLLNDVALQRPQRQAWVARARGIGR